MILNIGLLILFGIGIFLYAWKNSIKYPLQSIQYNVMQNLGQVGFWCVCIGLILLFF